MDTEPAGLQERWERLLPSAPELADPLLVRWSEPHRRYHTTRHLQAVLDHIEALAEPYHDQQLVALAAWYHDAVYLVPAGEISNEEASAQLAEADLAGRLAPDRVAEVARLVRVTADHRTAADDVAGALLCDADLAILASDEADYLAYAVQVRAEYRHVPDDRFRVGRRAVLLGLLDRPRLFATPRGAELEGPARRNLTAEVDRLAGPG